MARYTGDYVDVALTRQNEKIAATSDIILQSARVLATMRRAADYGLKQAHPEFDFSEVMERVQRVVQTVEPHDSVERYTALGVDCLEGEAKIVSPWEVEVKLAGGEIRCLTTRSIGNGSHPPVVRLDFPTAI
jgi:pyruvate/2-oxoglutarate dehydrogenase complex dihydrolipoamide dehydrogenase (E3) component